MLKLCSALSGAALALALATSAALAQEAIATADGETAGFRIDITELKRTSGDTLTMKFTIVNDSGEGVLTSQLMEAGTAGNVHKVYLIDAAGKKKYLTISDANNRCVCSSDLFTSRVDSGKSLNLWAQFPAPPAEVKEVRVVFPHFIPTDAPISE